MSEKKKSIPIGACPYCFTVHPAAKFIPPVIPDNPNLIVVGQRYSEKQGLLLQALFTRLGINPAMLLARQCDLREEPDIAQIKSNRQNFLLPILDKLPKIPIVSLGQYAASYTLGGKHGETSHAGKTIELYDRVVSCSYHPSYYFESGQNKDILAHIEMTLDAAMRPIEEPKFIKGRLPKNVETIIIDVETTSSSYPWYGSGCVVLGVLPIGFVPYEILPEQLKQEDINRLNKETKVVVGHNLMYDLIHFRGLGVTFPNARFHDTMIYRKNLFPNEPKYGLKYLAKRYCKFPHWEAWFHRQLQDKVDLKTVDMQKFMQYNAYDLYATEQLYLKQTRAYQPFLLEMDYTKYVADMIDNGMFVHKERLEKLTADTKEELDKKEFEIRSTYGLGEDFNFNSPVQVRSLLERQGIQLRDTRESTLDEHKTESPIISDLLEIRNLSKLHGTSLEGLKNYVDNNQLVHSTINVHGAETGRSSSSKPNVQNTDPRVRPVFVSRYNAGRLVYTDLASIEYRLIAHVSRDPKLVKVFRENGDIHAMAFQQVFGRPHENKEERKKGKTINFAGVYGCGIEKFQLLTGTTDEKLFYKTQNLYPGVNRWKEEVIKQLHYNGRIRSIFGRTWEFLSAKPADEREAINRIIQSSGHDILDIYIMETMDEIKKAGLTNTLLINETHDSFTLDSPDEEYRIAFQIVEKVAQRLVSLITECFGVQMIVPITAEVKLLEEWE